MLNKQYKFGVVLLAAGLSSRMQGENKLLKQWRGRPLLSYSLDVVQNIGLDQLVLVAGHMVEDIKEQFNLGGMSLVHNSRPEEGMASSIVLGIEALGEDIDGVFICLGDMPLVSSDIFQFLAQAFEPENGKEICVPHYQGQHGHPVLFGKRFFPVLAELKGDKGARGILKACSKVVVSVEVESSGVVFDLDQVEDFAEEA